MFNKKQSEISTDEQFKSTFFNLLKVQRDILEKISGKFEFLGSLIYEELSWKNSDVKITKSGKEYLRIKNVDDEVRGLEFFKAARYQLTEIFNSLDHDQCYPYYDSEEAYEAEMDLRATHKSGSMIPPEVEREQNERITEVEQPFRMGYTNRKYGINQIRVR